MPNSWKVQGLTILPSRALTSLTDQEWTKEETDYLFYLIREYDSRFYIVNDRYEFPGGPPRSMEVRYNNRSSLFTYSGLVSGSEG